MWTPAEAWADSSDLRVAEEPRAACIRWYHYWVFAQRIKNINSKEYVHPNVYGSMLYKSQIMETVQMSIYR